MPEESIETQELRDQLEEAKEHAEAHEHHGKEGPRWTLYLSLSTAIIAVFAAVASLQSSNFESHALLAKNEAILAQAKATDTWGYYQAKGTKAAIYEAQAEVVGTSSPELSAKLGEKRAKYKSEQDEIEKEARTLDKEVKARDVEGERYFHTHHHFALSVTIFQVSIALSAIAALTRRRPLWLVSMLVGASGIFFFLRGLGVLGE